MKVGDIIKDKQGNIGEVLKVAEKKVYVRFNEPFLHIQWCYKSEVEKV